MPTNRSHNTSQRLPLALPALAPGNAYQLVHIGALIRRPTEPEDHHVEIALRPVDMSTGMPIASNPQVHYADIHVNHAGLLHASTMWTANGKRVARPTLSPFERRIFSLSGKTVRAQRLSDLLPDLTDSTAYPALRDFLTDDLLTGLGGTPFVSIKHRETTLLIPCLELARIFYFWAGAKLIDFFFHPGQASHFCEALTVPIAHNRRQARLFAHFGTPSQRTTPYPLPKGFTKQEMAVLAQLLFQPDFAASFAKAHANLIMWWTNHARAHLWLDLVLGKKVTMRAIGLPFRNGQARYLWVTTLSTTDNYFCFNKLEYLTLADYRSARIKAGGELQQASKSAMPRVTLAISGSPTQDHDQPGSRLYGSPQVQLEAFADELPACPQVIRDEKLLKTVCEEAVRYVLYGKPSILSSRGGGYDLSVAKVDLQPENIQLDVKRATYETYFRAVVNEFTLLAFKVELLTQNAPAAALAADELPVCHLPILKEKPLPRSYRVGVAQILQVWNGRHCYAYFFQVLASRSLRGGFVFKNDLESLTASDLNYLLRAIFTAKDNWSKVDKDFRDSLVRLISSLTINARNHRDGVDADVKRCAKEIRRAQRIIQRVS